jgi:hypothetical protein
VAVGAWKLVLTGGAVLGESVDPASRVELFNLSEDPHETRNRAAEFPGRVAQLRRHLAEFGRMQKGGVSAYAEGRSGFKAPKDWAVRD